jgi:hypothetical protein
MSAVVAAIPATAPTPAAVAAPALPDASWLVRIPRGLVLALAATLIYGELDRFSG